VVFEMLKPKCIYLRLRLKHWWQYQQLRQGIQAMPLITLRANKISSEKIRDSLAESLSLITEKILRKNKKLIVVRFEVANQQAQWYVGGAVKSDDAAIFELSIIVTKGTNTDEEKAEWIAQAWELVTQVLGSAPHPNYISIQEIDGKSWGYNGLSQEQRKIQST
jgi:4-oxalocrotonate tautomerase